MFAILVIVFFLTDGSKRTEAVLIPSPPTEELAEKACTEKANQYASDFHKHTDDAILGVGFKCDILDDPTVAKKGA